jgi:hypothetical protein
MKWYFQVYTPHITVSSMLHQFAIHCARYLVNYTGCITTMRGAKYRQWVPIANAAGAYKQVIKTHFIAGSPPS